jgi:aspartokinase
METIAVYWEPLIKTYGIVRRADLYLVSLVLTVDQMAGATDGFLSQWARDGKLLMVAAGPLESKGIRLQLVLDSPPSADQLKIPPETPENDPHPQPKVDAGVELVYFHGPHYGDRYGIVHAALSALESDDVPVLSVACSGASVYLVLPKGRAEAACNALSNVFVVPRR